MHSLDHHKSFYCTLIMLTISSLILPQLLIGNEDVLQDFSNRTLGTVLVRRKWQDRCSLVLSRFANGLINRIPLPRRRIRRVFVDAGIPFRDLGQKGIEIIPGPGDQPLLQLARFLDSLHPRIRLRLISNIDDGYVTPSAREMGVGLYWGELAAQEKNVADLDPIFYHELVHAIFVHLRAAGVLHPAHIRFEGNFSSLPEGYRDWFSAEELWAHRKELELEQQHQYPISDHVLVTSKFSEVISNLSDKFIDQLGSGTEFSLVPYAPTLTTARRFRRPKGKDLFLKATIESGEDRVKVYIYVGRQVQNDQQAKETGIGLLRSLRNEASE